MAHVVLSVGRGRFPHGFISRRAARTSRVNFIAHHSKPDPKIDASDASSSLV
jgi:hypothetical protein